MISLVSSINSGISRPDFERVQGEIANSPAGWNDAEFLVHLLMQVPESRLATQLTKEYLAKVTDFSSPAPLPPSLLASNSLPAKVPWLALAPKSEPLALEVFKRVYEGGSRFTSDFASSEEVIRIIQRSFKNILKRERFIEADDLAFVVDAHKVPILSPEILACHILKYVTFVDVASVAIPACRALLDREDLNPNTPLPSTKPGGPPSFLLRHFLMVDDPNMALVDLLLDAGADVALAEGSGSSFLAHVGKRFNASDKQEQGLKLFETLLSRGASITAKDDNGVPVPHSLAHESGQRSERRFFKKLFLAMLAAGLDINVGLTEDELQGMTLRRSEYTHFVGATPRDFNYRGNENLFSFFDKRQGVRRYSS